MRSGTLIEEKEDDREDKEDKDEGGGDSLGGGGALLVMGVESIKERTYSIIALLLAEGEKTVGGPSVLGRKMLGMESEGGR